MSRLGAHTHIHTLPPFPRLFRLALNAELLSQRALTYPMAELLLHADTTVNLFTSYFDVGRLVTWRDVYLYTTLEYDS